MGFMLLPSLTYLELASELRHTAKFADVACYISYNAYKQTDLARYVVTRSSTSDTKPQTFWLEYVRSWYPSPVTKRNAALILNSFGCF